MILYILAHDLSIFGAEVVFKGMNISFIFLSECDEHHPCQGLGEHAHFRSFGMAFLTLFRIATGILYDDNHFQFITKERKR